MEQGPFRMSRSADRSANSRPAAASRLPEIEDAKPVIEEPKEPKPVHRPAPVHHPRKEEKSKKSLIVTIAIIVAVIILGIGGWSLISGMSAQGTAIDGSKYQAVFFTNGQVYFGKLHSFNDEYMKLTDVYYLQTDNNAATDSKNPQATSSDQNNPKLIKLGDEIHGPQDEMIISKDQLLFYENLKSDGKVSQSIEKFKNPN